MKLKVAVRHFLPGFVPFMVNAAEHDLVYGSQQCFSRGM